jgi:hypothetical protein
VPDDTTSKEELRQQAETASQASWSMLVMSAVMAAAFLSEPAGGILEAACAIMAILCGAVSILAHKVAQEAREELES